MSIKKFNLNDEIFSRIRLVNDNSKLKQKEFAERIKITPGYLSEILSGKKVPSSQLLKIISMEFDVDFNWLLTGKGEMREIPVVREPGPQYEKSPVDDYGAKVLAIAGQVISIGTEDERRQKIQAIADLVADMMKSKA